MNLIIIYPDILNGAAWTGYFYTGIGYLSAVMKKAGHRVSLIHVTHPPEQLEFMRTLGEILSSDDSALIAFSSTTNMFGYVKLWSSWIKSQYRKNLTIAGGVHPTLNPDETIAVDGVDIVCIGEGEEPLLELADALQNGRDITSIRNLWIKTKENIHKNPTRPFIKNLDAIPFPDRGLFDYENLDREREGIGVFMASRGCPYDCFYCCNHAIKKCTEGASGYVRFRSVDNVISEIKQALADYPFIKLLHFDDDILPINKKWFKDFSDKYAKEISLPFECNIRPNLVDEITIELLKNAGCKTLRLGLESGNAFIRNKILNRGLSEETLVKAATLCKEAGIRLYTFNMVGLPFEDMPARLDTVKLNARINSDEEQISIFYPYEKTRLFDICLEQKLIRDNETAVPVKDTALFFEREERNRIVFTAYFFPLLVRVYRIYLKLPALLARTLIKVSDAILSSKCVAKILYPALISFMIFLSRHQRLEAWARRVKHAIMN